MFSLEVKVFCASHTHHNKVVEDGGDQVCGDEGEVRGQELCVGADGDVGGDLSGRERGGIRIGVCGALPCLPASSRRPGSLRWGQT